MIWIVTAMVVGLGVHLLMPRLIAYLERKAVLDMPNARSSHSVPTPRGGGWLAMGLPLVALILFTAFSPLAAPLQLSLAALGAALILLMVISGLDDKISLSPRQRLIAHVTAAALIVLTLPESVRVFPALPLPAEQGVLILGTVWMINLTNFIDGINGITAANALSLALGLAMAACLMPAHPTLVVLSLSAALIAGGMGGFLYWNVPAARVFLGDAGSVPLGLWQAYALIFIAAIFGLVPALLLCLYPLLDATVTLIKRAARREKIWEAHRSHFYQQAVQNGRSHARTSALIFGFNLMCVALTAVSILHPALEYPAIGLGIILFGALARHFTRPAVTETPS